MIGRDLALPLEDDWRATLDGIARARGWPTSHDVARLGARVAELSASYNDASRARAAMKEAGAARLGFAFARDVPKSAAAVRELVATKVLALSSSPLRVLDVGAGLGATTWGALRALEAAGAEGVIDATWIDEDARALELGASIARARDDRGGGVRLRCSTKARSATSLADLPRFDLVLAGQVLSELDVGLAEDERVARHAALLGSWLERNVEEHGSLVVVEPALRDRTRHLHRVRDALATSGATVFAPCLHAAPCPALARETDWCHEDISVDLPAWLAPVARAAGLRYEGLTFSYLVLRRDGRTLATSVPSPSPTSGLLRVVSGAMPSKGKVEAFLCGDFAVSGGRTAARARVMRLDRDAGPATAAWDDLARGDVLVVDPAPQLDRPRIATTGSVHAITTSGGAETR